MNKSTLRSLRATVDDLRDREQTLSRIVESLRIVDRRGAAGVVLDHLISVLTKSIAHLADARVSAQDAELELSKLMGED